MVWRSLPIRETVANALMRLASQRAGGMTLLISGPPGLYQERVALHLAQAVLCERRDGDACGECSACRRVTSGLHPDLLTFRPEGANHKIEALRTAKEQASLHAFEGDRKVISIQKADRMLMEGANSLLKVLEEPPAHVLFVLCTDHHESILATILSRCRHIQLSPLGMEHLSDWMSVNHPEIGMERTRTIARLAGGRPGLAEELLGDDWAEQRDAVVDMLASVRKPDPLAVVNEAQKLSKDRPKARQTLVTLLGLVRDGLMLCEGVARDALVHGDCGARLDAVWRGSTADQMIQRFETTAEGIRHIDANHNVQATLEGVLRSYL